MLGNFGYLQFSVVYQFSINFRKFCKFLDFFWKALDALNFRKFSVIFNLPLLFKICFRSSSKRKFPAFVTKNIMWKNWLVSNSPTTSLLFAFGSYIILYTPLEMSAFRTCSTIYYCSFFSNEMISRPSRTFLLSVQNCCHKAESSNCYLP